jgi:putative SOS response-associated peptidase YedK
MCNEVARRIAVGQVREDWSQLRIPLRFPEGVPNLAPLESIRITDPAAIIRSAGDARDAAELVIRRWSWPGPSGRPVYNFRSEGRDFTSGRCLVIADAFYEFTDSPAPSAEGFAGWGGTAGASPMQARPDSSRNRKGKKTRWRFTRRDEPWFCIAGIWRTDAQVGEAFTMLTTAPGPDVAPYHNRQIVILERADWPRWIDPAVPARELLKPSPAGSFNVERVD